MGCPKLIAKSVGTGSAPKAGGKPAAVSPKGGGLTVDTAINGNETVGSSTAGNSIVGVGTSELEKIGSMFPAIASTGEFKFK
jgi:hypothetical protein